MEEKMSRAWLIDGRGLASEVRNASVSSALRIKDCGANRLCPNCDHCIDNTDVDPEWPGLPKGVKFDPSDEEIIEHLEAKCGVGNSQLHPLIDEFIGTLDGDQGINYTHPENLPGANRDGIGAFFFHKNVKAYGTGKRKRRKIAKTSLNEDSVRWHKTGKSKAVMQNGVQKGCKKIMVLHKSAKNGSKPEKSKWVLHQYHLGIDGEEESADFVCSKVFYQQQKQCDEEAEMSRTCTTTPRTPNPNLASQPKGVNSLVRDDVLDDEYRFDSSVHVTAYEQRDQVEDYKAEETWLAGESQAIEDSGLKSPEDSLLCKESTPTSSRLKDQDPDVAADTGNNRIADHEIGFFALSDLENIDLGTPPELPDLQFDSQDSYFNWIDR